MSYKSTVRACYTGTICQAIIVSLTALLFTALGYQFGLTYTQLGSLVLINFITQVSVALLFGNVIDRVGFRPFAVGAHFAAAAGLAFFASTPWLPFPPYIMLLIGTFIFGAAGGFLEILISPILNAIPSDEKSSAMSILHAYFCFGHVGVAVGTTLLLAVLGREAWPIAVFLWLLLPLVNGVQFIFCPIAPAVPYAQQSSVRDAFKRPIFVLFIFMIMFAGATELTFAQWASAFLEESMGLTKALGDILGVGAFALAMGLGRIAYGILKKKNVPWLPEQSKLMLVGAALTAASYIILATTYNPVFALLACALSGLGVALLWPGALSLAVTVFPMAGTWMFAIMAASGNIGGSIGPVAFGMIADYGGLRLAYTITAVIPLGSVLMMFLYGRLRRD